MANVTGPNNEHYGTTSGSVTNATIVSAYGTALGAGDVLFFVGMASESGSATNGVTPSLTGVTWTRLTETAAGTPEYDVQIWRGVVTGSTSGNDLRLITNEDQATYPCDWWVATFANFNLPVSSGQIDTNYNTTSAPFPVIPGPNAPAGKRCVVITACIATGNDLNGGPGYSMTALTVNNTGRFAVAYQISNTGTDTDMRATWTTVASGYWAAASALTYDTPASTINRGMYY